MGKNVKKTFLKHKKCALIRAVSQFNQCSK